jgi:raffinose/stachyose/melibiose transport system permease protein
LRRAYIDGTTELQTNLRIKLPLLKNAIGTGTILAATSMPQKLDILIMTSNPEALDRNFQTRYYKIHE